MIFGFNRETAYASCDGALIEHQYLETGHRQIGGANKTVVATTDNDHIVHHPPFHKP
jgi:3-hydroxy-3-methylglutaryl CoA synthase